MKKIISILLLAVMLVSVLAACDGKKPEDTSSHQTGDGSSGDDGPYIMDATLDGYVYTVLVAGNIDYNHDYGSDFYYEEEGSDKVDQARSKWIKGTEEKFDIKIETVEKLKFQDCRGSGQGYKEIQKVEQSQTPTYDSVMIGVYDMSNLAKNGYLSDLNSFEYLNTKNQWWDQVANKDLTIQGKLYYTTGDISIIDNIFTHCILFNKEMIKANPNLTSPYTYVENDTWTMDRFLSMVKEAADTSGEGDASKKNVYGLLTWNDSGVQLMASADERILSVNDDGMLEFDFYNERTQKLYTDWKDVGMNPAYSFNYQYDKDGSGEGWDAVRKRMFDSNQALFYTTLFSSIVHHRDSETDFGILPYPKLDENQENYGHLISAFHSEFFAIPYTHADSDVSASVSEYMAYLGQTTTKPAYYEDTLQGSYFRDDESAAMLDIIFASRVYDVGIYYNVGGLTSVLADFHTANKTIQVIYNEKLSMVEQIVKSLNEQYANA